jgi:DNA-directed RNA polymerase specialized sigma24 family protein
MHVDEPKTKELVGRLVQKMTSNPTLWDDLHQEALIHLWLTEAHRPGQTRSWYLQSCKFHLLHYLASGRSVDSIKRRDGQMPYETQLEDQSERPDLADPGACVLSFVSARELVSMLSLRLLPTERAVLGCLADGLGPREIGRRLKISHTMVLKHRSKIASLLDNLENSAGRSRRLLSAPLLPPVFIAQNSRLVA